MKFDKLVSIVIPAYKAESSIYKLAKELITILKDFNIEIVIVNDFSPDNTHQECIKLLKENPDKITYIKLRKNAGEHNAVMAGLNHAYGEWILILDDDFQNPPSEVLKLIDYAVKTNYDVIYGDYREKKHNFFRNFISKVNDLTANFILGKPPGIYLSSFKILNKKILSEISKYSGPYPYIDGLILSITSNINSIKTVHAKRSFGKSGYSLIKLIKLYGNLVTNFSTMPIHLFSIIGFAVALFSGLLGIMTIIYKIVDPTLPIGYTSIFLAIIFFAGVQLSFLGLLGEYIGKILKNVNKEPQYSIEYIKLNDSKNKRNL